MVIVNEKVTLCDSVTEIIIPKGYHIDTRNMSLFALSCSNGAPNCDEGFVSDMLKNTSATE